MSKGQPENSDKKKSLLKEKLSSQVSGDAHPAERISRKLTDSISDGVIYLDQKLNVTYANDSISHMTGIPKQDLLNRPALELAQQYLDGKLQETVAEEIHLLMQGTLVPKRRITHHNHILDAEILVGEPESPFIGVFKDITHQKIIPQKHYPAERLYKLLCDSLINPVVLYDKDAKILMLNMKAAENLGVPADDCIGKPLGEFIPENQQLTVDRIRKVIRTSQPLEVEDHVRLPGGDYWFWTVIQPVIVDHGKEPRVLMISYDNTQKKHAELALRHNEEKYRNLVNTLQEGIWQIDTKGYTTFVNPRMAEILGYQTEEMLGKHVFEFMDNKRVEVARRKLENRQNGISEHHEFVFRNKNGQKVNVLINTNPLYDDTGKHIGALAGVSDISLFKKTEVSLRDSEKRLHQLSIRLMQIQEQEYQHISRELHDEMGQSLTAISINLYRIRQSLTDDCKSFIRESIEESLLLVDNINKQLNEMIVKLRPSVLDDLGLIPTLRWYIKHFGEHTGLTVTHNFSTPERRYTKEIEIVLYRIVQEALINIAKHAMAQKVDVVLQHYKDELKLIIEDDGQGFEPMPMESIPSFERGIGMMGMRERLYAVNGELEVHSAIGKGTRLVAILKMEEEQ